MAVRLHVDHTVLKHLICIIHGHPKNVLIPRFLLLDTPPWSDFDSNECKHWFNDICGSNWAISSA